MSGNTATTPGNRNRAWESFWTQEQPLAYVSTLAAFARTQCSGLRR
jgi:hypothetical protein